MIWFVSEIELSNGCFLYAYQGACRWFLLILNDNIEMVCTFLQHEALPVAANWEGVMENGDGRSV